MKRLTLLSKILITKITLAIIVFFIFGLLKLSIFLFMVLLALCIFFRHQKNDLGQKKSLDIGIISCPISGTIDDVLYEIDGVKIIIKLKSLRNIGIYMPMDGIIEMVSGDNVKENEFEIIIRDESMRQLKMKIIPQLSLFGAKFFLRSGDIIHMGAIMGFFNFSGKVVIEMPLNNDILVKKGDRVTAFKTLLSNFKE